MGDDQSGCMTMGGEPFGEPLEIATMEFANGPRGEMSTHLET